jgi:IS4 transposase
LAWDEENKREIVLLTNHLTWSATTIGKIYKERRQIELFFKALKQNLCIRTFVGPSENAVKTQIWISLIAMLLLKYLIMRSTYEWSLSNLAAMVRMNPLTYRNFWIWLNRPFHEPEKDAPALQMLLLG